jgi:hypothetical protein
MDLWTFYTPINIDIYNHGLKSLVVCANIDIPQIIKGGIEIYQTLFRVLLRVMCLNQQIRM